MVRTFIERAWEDITEKFINLAELRIIGAPVV